jgi:hypothetical protein
LHALEEQVAKVAEGSAADVRSVQSAHTAEVSALRLEHRQAVEQQERDFSAKVAQLANEHQRELQDMLSKSLAAAEAEHAKEREKIEERLRAEAQEDLAANNRRLVADHKAAHTVDKDAHVQELAVLRREHDCSVKVLEARAAEETGALAESLAQVQAKMQAMATQHDEVMASLKSEHASALAKQEMAAKERVSQQSAQVAAMTASHASALEEQRTTAQKLAGDTAAMVAALKDEHLLVLAEHEGKAREAAACHAATLSSEKQLHAAALAEQKSVWEQELQAAVQGATEELNTRHNLLQEAVRQEYDAKVTELRVCSPP